MPRTDPNALRDFKRMIAWIAVAGVLMVGGALMAWFGRRLR